MSRLRDCLRVLCLALLTLTTHAEEALDQTDSMFRDRLHVFVGAYFAGADTTLRVDARNGLIGTKLNLEDDLDLDKSKALLFLGANWRFAQRHQLQFEFFELGRSGKQNLDATIRFGEDEFQIGTEIDSFLDTDVIRLGYGYSFFGDESKEFGVEVGLHLTDIETGIRAVGTIGDDEAIDGVEFADATAPLPVIGVQGAWQLAPKWSVRGRIQIFRLEFNDYDGALNHAQVTIAHNTFERVGFAFNYDFFEIDVDAVKRDLTGNVNFRFGGPGLLIFGRF